MRTKLLKELRARFIWGNYSKYSFRICDVEVNQVYSISHYDKGAALKFMLTRIGFADKYKYFFICRRFRRLWRTIKSGMLKTV